MCRYGKIHDEYEYRELYKRKIVPTNLIPKDPSMYYKPKPERILKIRNMNKLFEKKYGRKYTGSDKDRKLRHKVYEELPDVKARRAKRSQESEYKASQKISAKKYRSTPEYKARVRVREQLPKVIARRKVLRNKPETKAKAKARRSTPEFKAKRKARRSTPEYIAYQKAYRQRPEYKSKQNAYQNKRRRENHKQN
jgi:hypothetical protein